MGETNINVFLPLRRFLTELKSKFCTTFRGIQVLYRQAMNSWLLFLFFALIVPHSMIFGMESSPDSDVTIPMDDIFERLMDYSSGEDGEEETPASIEANEKTNDVNNANGTNNANVEESSSSGDMECHSAFDNRLTELGDWIFEFWTPNDVFYTSRDVFGPVPEFSLERLCEQDLLATTQILRLFDYSMELMATYQTLYRCRNIFGSIVISVVTCEIFFMLMFLTAYSQYPH